MNQPAKFYFKNYSENPNTLEFDIFNDLNDLRTKLQKNFINSFKDRQLI